MASNFFAFSEQPQYSSQPNQKFKIDGFKFFQGTLDMLKGIIATSDKQPSKTIPSSALSAFLGAHALCHENGILPADFNIAMLEKTTGVKYDSIRKGFQWCVRKAWITKTMIDGTLHYKITGYEEFNNSKSEKPRYEDNEEHKLSYFRVPKAVLTTGILGQLVHNKDTSGIITLLEFCNYFSRQLMNTKENISDYECVRKMSYLKKVLRRKPHQIRQYLTDVIQKIFAIELKIVQERKPRERADRKRKPVVQLVVSKVKLVLTELCAKVNDDLKKIDEKIANFSKNIADVLRYASRKIQKQDMEDIRNAFRDEVGLIMSYMEKESDRKALYRDIFDIVCRYIDKTRMEGTRIESIGGFIRDALRKAVDIWKNTPETRLIAHDVAVRYAQEHGEYPAFILRGRNNN
ncbi:hypothetical protein [Thermaerobacillus caldiproteolyticus]|uniref:hypothetical protein n=1 Tax=Thermaerobacillus caldiproteolyticus TaxID=247480 RepID=UPI00188BAD23|nr:hypothetical protein [Anoxybacillus caldiproteolyticus]QPA33394.1 hypothetical protein ISX45_19285 [Anoxybacillus caldiproteolyticus]